MNLIRFSTRISCATVLLFAFSGCAGYQLGSVKPATLPAGRAGGELLRAATRRADADSAERTIAAGWETKGATPHATLYAAMIREIKAKGKDARFEKADRGQFQLRKGA